MADSGIAKIADTLRNQNSGGFRMAQPVQPPVQNITVVQQGSQSVQSGTTDGDKQIIRALTDIYSILQSQLSFERQAHQEDKLKQSLIPKEFQTDISAIRESEILSSIDQNIKELLKKDFGESSKSSGLAGVAAEAAAVAAGLSGLKSILKTVIPALGSFVAGLSGESGGLSGSIVGGGAIGGIPGAIVGAAGWAAGRIVGREPNLDPRIGRWDDVGGPGTKIRPSDKPMTEDEFTKLRTPKGLSGNSSSDKAMKFFMDKGWSKEQSAGIVGNLQVESGNFSEDVVSGKRKGDKGQAVGIAQWHPDRQKNFEKLFGKKLAGSSLEEQLEFVNYELQKGSEKKAGKKIAATKTAEEAAEATDLYYERSSGEARGQRKKQAKILSQTDYSKERQSATKVATAAENKTPEPSTWSKFKTWATKPLWGEGSDEPVKTAKKESQVAEGGKYAEEESEMEESDEPILTEDGQAQKLTKESSDGGYTDYFQQMVSLLSTIAEKVGGDKEEEEDDEEEETSETAQREDETQEEPQPTAKKEYAAPQQSSPNLVNLGVTPMTQQSMNPMGTLQGVLSTAQQGMMMGNMFGNMGRGGMGGIGAVQGGLGMVGSVLGMGGSILGSMGQQSPIPSGIGSAMGALGSISGVMSGIQGMQNMGRGGMGGIGAAQGILGMGQSVLGSVQGLGQGLGQGIGNAFGGLFGPTPSKVGTIVDGKPVYGENQINKSTPTSEEEVSPNQNKVGQSLNIDSQVKQISEIDRKMNDPNQPMDTRSDQQRIVEQEITANQNKVGQSLTSSPNVSSLGAGSDSSSINPNYSMIQETPSTGAKLEGLTTTVASAKEERMVPQESQPTIINNGGGGQSQPSGGGTGTPSPEGVMGIDIGVRTDEPTLLRAQYGSIRTV